MSSSTIVTTDCDASIDRADHRVDFELQSRTRPPLPLLPVGLDSGSLGVTVDVIVNRESAVPEQLMEQGTPSLANIKADAVTPYRTVLLGKY
jgi:hypothetical protein